MKIGVVYIVELFKDKINKNINIGTNISCKNV